MRKIKNLLLIIAITFSAISFANTDPVSEGKLVKEIQSMLTTPSFGIEDVSFNIVFTITEDDIIKILRFKDVNHFEIKIDNEYTKFIKEKLNGRTVFSPTKTNYLYFLPIKFKQLKD
tara:strand:- start:2288 stop:2638 length:351 start_codon:yes stop_codon:yes gene_type:complete